MNKSILEKVPNKSGVYIWKNKNKVLYIGKAKNLKKRLEQYFRIGNVWKEDMVAKATDIDWILTQNEQEALVLESNLIKKYQPPYNNLLKGDNHYTYIRIGTGDFPKIEFTRFKDKEGIYIGPKAWKKELKDIFQILKRILKFRTCSEIKFKKGKLCSEYTLGLCKGWCSFIKVNNENQTINEITPKQTYQAISLEYKQIIKLLKDFFNGKTKEVKKLILEKINQAVKEENFEYAQILKNIYLKLDKFEQKQFVELNKNITGYFIKIREFKGIYFMVYVKIVEGKIIDVIKLSDTENNFLQTMKNEGLIKEFKKLEENFYFAK